MKKKLFAAVTLAAIPLLLTGCGGKKLVCTQKEDSMEMKYSISFKKDKVDTIKFTTTIDLAAMGVTEDQLKGTDLCETFVKSDDDMKEAVKSCKSDIKDKKATVTATLDASKMDNESGMDSSQSYDDAKKFFEGIGMTCK